MAPLKTLQTPVTWTPITPPPDPWDESTAHLERSNLLDHMGRAVHVWASPVIFGWRIQAGSRDHVWVDYCAGASPMMQLSVWHLVHRAFERGAEYADFPRQEVRPMHRDRACYAALAALAGVRAEPEAIDAILSHAAREQRAGGDPFEELAARISARNAAAASMPARGPP